MCWPILKNKRYSFKHTSSTERGLSDHHHLISSMTKTTFEKEEAKVLVYQNYKNFRFNSFKSELLSKFHLNNVTFTFLENNFVNVLNQQDPKKIKSFWGNKKQRNLVVKLNKKYKIEYFENLNTASNSKPFWDKCKPYFSNKHAKGISNIMLIEKD